MVRYLTSIIIHKTPLDTPSVMAEVSALRNWNLRTLNDRKKRSKNEHGSYNNSITFQLHFREKNLLNYIIFAPVIHPKQCDEYCRFPDKFVQPPFVLNLQQTTLSVPRKKYVPNFLRLYQYFSCLLKSNWSFLIIIYFCQKAIFNTILFSICLSFNTISNS